MAALAAYPSLACTDGPFQVSPYFRTHEDILCVCDEATFDFLFGVFDEVMELFPSPVIHFGGDEVPTVRWEQSADCATRMSELGFTDASQLQGWTMDRLANYLEAHGRRAQGWNEVLHDGLPTSVIVQRWKSRIDVVEAAIASGHQVVQSPYEPTYLNRDYETVSLTDAYALDSGAPRGGRGCDPRHRGLHVDPLALDPAGRGVPDVPAARRLRRGRVDAGERARRRRLRAADGDDAEPLRRPGHRVGIRGPNAARVSLDAAVSLNAGARSPSTPPSQPP